MTDRLSLDAERDALVRSYWKIIRGIARRLHLPPHVDIDDLMSAGAMGLLGAAESFDPNKCDFRRWATSRIRHAMLDELRELDWMTRPQREHWTAVGVAMSKLRGILGRPPDDIELAAELGMPVDVFRARRARLNRAVAPAPDWHEGHHDPTARSGFDAVATREEVRTLAAAVCALPERLQGVLIGHYWRGQGLREIGDTLGVTESRVCQMRKEALARLRKSIDRQAA